MSTAEKVRGQVAAAPLRGFIAAAKLSGSRRAVECELSRLAAGGDVVRVRKGLYWKGPKTRFGMAAPRPAETALEVAGLGAGPAEVAAAHLLGLTTQVPSVAVVAVPGRVPVAVPGARFVSRSIERRFVGLRPVEVALLEVLRGGPALIEKPWSAVSETAARLVAGREVRIDVLASVVASEHHVATRERWAKLTTSTMFERLVSIGDDRVAGGESTGPLHHVITIPNRTAMAFQTCNCPSEVSVQDPRSKPS